MNDSPGPIPPDLREVVVADVWKDDRFAATLTRTDGGVRFAYTAEYLSQPGPAVATTLPLSETPVLTPAGAVPPFFAGLLPEGRRLSSLRRAIKTSADDDLSLVVAVGADTIGDVRVLPQGTVPSAVRPLIEVVRRWDEVSFAELLNDAGIRDPSALPGVQDKASARMLSVPVHRAGAAYILKVDPPEYPNLVRNEAYFLDLARDAGFPAARAHIVLDRDERPGLLVERFDRVWDAGTASVDRLPMEDGAQVLGLYPADKYRVTTEALASALAGHCAAQALAAREILRQVLFAWLTGNGDLHAKNLSILGDGSGEWRVSPAYDVPSTIPYGDHTLALSVGGRTDGLARRAWLAFAAAIGVPERAALRTMADVLSATEPLLSDWGDMDRSPLDARATRDVLRVADYRRRQMGD